MEEITSSNVKTFTMNDLDTACRTEHAVGGINYVVERLYFINGNQMSILEQ
jgi:hypothetical protein